jgi:transcriptional regulator with XRE-family HTH domain
VNIDSSLTKELRNKEYRDAYVASQIRINLSFQIRALRKARGLSQGELAALAGMAQPRISEIEKPGERGMNIETLLRVASALEVGVQIRFVSFGDLVEWAEGFEPDSFQVPGFEAEIAGLQRASGAGQTGFPKAAVDAGRLYMDVRSTSQQIFPVQVVNSRERPHA